MVKQARKITATFEIVTPMFLGGAYEYFLGQFAGSEGKRGGEFYTPRSVVGTMVAMLEPHKGRVYDP
jgi:type I restriction enzyme M protein